MKKVLQFAVMALIVAGCGCGMSPQEKLTVNDKKINEIIAQMTLEEKVEMLHSKTNMSSEGGPRQVYRRSIRHPRGERRRFPFTRLDT